MAEIPSEAWLYTLLYIEDDPANLQLIERIVARRADTRLLSALNGVSGIAMARASLPTVILMDINLPDMSGFKALEILRSEAATAHIPVIALTGNATPLNIESGLEAGFFHYLTKPMVLGEFTHALDRALASAARPVRASAHTAPR